MSETELVKDGSALPLDTRLCDALCGQQSLRLTVRRAAKDTADGEDSASSTSEAEPVEGTAESSIASALSSVEKLVADVVGTGVSINPRMVQNHHLAPPIPRGRAPRHSASTSLPGQVYVALEHQLSWKELEKDSAQSAAFLRGICGLITSVPRPALFAALHRFIAPNCSRNDLAKIKPTT